MHIKNIIYIQNNNNTKGNTNIKIYNIQKRNNNKNRHNINKTKI